MKRTPDTPSLDASLQRLRNESRDPSDPWTFAEDLERFGAKHEQERAVILDFFSNARSMQDVDSPDEAAERIRHFVASYQKQNS